MRNVRIRLSGNYRNAPGAHGDGIAFAPLRGSRDTAGDGKRGWIDGSEGSAAGPSVAPMDTGPVVMIALLVYAVTFVIGKSSFGYVNKAMNPP